MLDPLPQSELDALAADLDHPRPYPDLPEKLASGSNVAYISAEENDRLVCAAIARGLGRFDKLSFDDTHRMAARMSRAARKI